MRTLSEVLQAPDHVNLEKFFSTIPTVFNVVIFSVHGYFGQADVLGLPDTGGQVKFPTLQTINLIIRMGVTKIIHLMAWLMRPFNIMSSTISKKKH